MGLNQKKSCLIIAGEKSGEEHALSFLSQIIQQHPHIQFFGVGGDQLEKEGVELLYHLKNFSGWGISEVLSKIPFYLKAKQNILEETKIRNTKQAILIDFQTFNLNLAKSLTKRGIKVFYYVAPQAWAWKAYRAKLLAKYTNSLFCLLPFEKKWFKTRGVTNVYSVAHPLSLGQYPTTKAPPQKGEVKKILLLPGSRSFEVQALLPQFAEAIKKLKQTSMVSIGIVPSPNLPASLFAPYQNLIDHTFSYENINDACSWAHVAISASGTITLQTALNCLPTIVCYKASLLTGFVFYNFINYKGPIALANLFFNERILPELLDEQANDFEIARILQSWFADPNIYAKMTNKLASLQNLVLGDQVDVAKVISDQIFKN